MGSLQGAVLVAVRQHREEASALDGGVDLALENRAGASQASRNDLAVLADKITQGVDVFVVDFFHASSGNRQKRLRLNSRDCVLRFGRLSLLKRLGPAMMGSRKINKF